MKQYKVTLSVTLLCSTLTAVLATGMTACGKLKTSDEKVVSVAEGTPNTNSREWVQPISEFFDVYAASGALSKQALENILARFQPQLESAAGVKDIDSKILTDAFLQVFGIKGDQIAPKELVESMKKELFMLTWFSPSTVKLTPRTLSEAINRQFPNVRSTTRRLFAKSLMDFDKSWSGGNEDGTIDKKELTIASLLTAGLFKADPSQEYNLGSLGIIDEKIAYSILNSKLQLQLLGRHSGTLSRLNTSSRRIEFTCFALTLFHLNNWMSRLVLGKMITVDQLKDVVASLLPNLSEETRQDLNYPKLLALYDSPALSGDENAHLSILELWNLLTDLDSASRLVININSYLPSDGSLATLRSAFPQIQNGLGQSDYWKSIELFRDEAPNGIVSDITLTQRTLMIGISRVTDFVYQLYDTNQDQLLSQEEMEPFFKRLGSISGFKKTAFFNDIALDGNASFGQRIKILRKTIFSKKKQPLSPEMFFPRLAKVIQGNIDEKQTVE